MTDKRKRNSLIARAKEESSKRGKFSLVIENFNNTREFMKFENGEMIMYDITGKDTTQISLSVEELKIIKEKENNGFNKTKKARAM